ncbi:3-oxoacyl-reductase [Microdochium bolleyi]|uniref:3-oxoacyl-reductase n=1 Tax=Microdochium bolleyi TaxID=196109 RepID=A0A136JJL9_9PEZI|nr:3-oxoacyl-reductase [Microdochium bolleyi]
MAGFSIDGVAIVTGAATSSAFDHALMSLTSSDSSVSASGIGKETAIAFAAEGAAAVVFADINLKGAQDAAEISRQLGKSSEYRALALKVDVGDAESVAGMVATVVEAFGRIDYSINCAGLVPETATTIPDADVRDLERLHRVHVVGMLNCIQEVGKVMKSQAPATVNGRYGPRASTIRGTIVNVSSMFGLCVGMGQMPYTVTKHAMIGLSKNAALDMAPHGVRVNTLVPGWVDTPMTSDVPGLAAARIRRSVEVCVPIARMATAEEIADVALFLASPRSSYMYGASVQVDGGLMLGPHRNRPGEEEEGSPMYSW